MNNYSLGQRIKAKLFGRCYLRHDTKPDWTGKLPFYLAHCSRHGYFEDYPHGWKEYLSCPACLEEDKKKNRE